MRSTPCCSPLILVCLGVTACSDPAVVDPTGTTSGEDSSTGAITTPGSTTDGTDATGLPGSESGDGSSTGADTSADESTTTGAIQACGNDVLEGDEVCDGTALGDATCVGQGFDAGELSCAADCTAVDDSACTYFQCNNNTVEGREQCDGTDLGGTTCQSEGFDSGLLACTNNCMLDTSECGTCGNVIVDGDEVCDDIVLFGQTCQSQGFDSGNLACTPDCLTYDTSGCGLCGNDIVDGNEECDLGQLGGQSCVTAGFDSGTLGCDDASCTFETTGCGVCGNNVVDGDELCDDGNTGTQCLADCTFCPGGVLFEEDFSDNSAGWTLGTEWGIGPAVMSASPGSCGNGDPGTDHSASVDNGVAGVVIGGNASTALHPFYYLTSPVIDTSGYSFLQLDMWRWLNSDYTPFMQNHIQVWDGAAWQTVWQTGGSPGVADAAWANVLYDIAAYGNPAMQVRIGFNIDNLGVYVCSQWNVDDFRIIGVNCP
jgi:hypothetical protein